MEEKEVMSAEAQVLLTAWKDSRGQLIVAQIAPTLVLIAVFVLAAQGTFTDATDAARYLVIGVTAITGALAIVSQIAIIREGHALLVDLSKVSGGSQLAKQIASSKMFLTLTAAGIVVGGLIIFILVIWSVFA